MVAHSSSVANKKFLFPDFRSLKTFVDFYEKNFKNFYAFKAFKGQYVQNFLPVCPVCPFMFFYMFTRLLCFDPILKFLCVYPAIKIASFGRSFMYPDSVFLIAHTPHVDSVWFGRIDFWSGILAWETIYTFHFFTTICSFLSTNVKYKSLKLLKFTVLQSEFESML